MNRYWLLIICVLFLGCNTLKSNDNKTLTAQNNLQPYEAEPEGYLHYFIVSYPNEKESFWYPEIYNLYTLTSFYIPIKLIDSKRWKTWLSRPDVLPAEKLVDLPNHERLKITGDVRNLSFLKDFTHIKYLHLCPLDMYFEEDIDSYYKETLEPLKYLVNLEELIVEMQLIQKYENDISPIGSLTQLKKLKLNTKYPEFLLDLESLQPLVNLEELTLISKNLRDLSFIENMKKLKYIKIDQTETVNINPIGKLTNLESLILLIDDGIINIDPIGNLTNLKSLSLGCNKGWFISSSDIFANLSGLEELTIRTGNEVDLAFIGILPKLKELNIYSTYVDISLLNNPELEYLEINYFITEIAKGVYGKDPKCKDIDDLKPLLKLPKLERIMLMSVSDVDIFLPLIESNSIKFIYFGETFFYNSNFPIEEFEKRGIIIYTNGR